MKAAIYTRVSTAKQGEEGYSLDEQVHRCRKLIGTTTRTSSTAVSTPSERAPPAPGCDHGSLASQDLGRLPRVAPGSGDQLDWR
jgi:hypothetical protein